MIDQLVVCFLPYMQYQVVTLLAVSFESAKTSFQVLEKETGDLTDMRAFFDFPSDSLECTSTVAAFQFVCYLYQENKAVSNINELRYEMFRNQISVVRLPRNFNLLFFHLRTSNYQTFIWKCEYMRVLNLPSPSGTGWRMEDRQFYEELILNSSVPDAIVELTRCKCKKGL